MENGQIVSIAPMAGFCCVSIVLVIGFVLLIVFFIKKAKGSSWQGKIVNKKINTSRDMEFNTESKSYVLIVEMSDGKKKNIGVSKKVYDSCSKGDNMRKDQGELYPKKVI